MAEGVGLYLGTRSINLVHVSGTFRAPRLVTTAQVELDRPLTDAPGAVSALAEPLQRLVRQAHLTAADAHLGLSADTAIIRYFQMPTVPSQDRVGAARFEAKKYHPFKLQELNADAHIVILNADPTVMRVMFYAVKKDLVAEYLHTFRQANVRPSSIETNLTSLMRAVRRTYQLPPQQAAVLISVDRETANIAIVQQDLVYLARNVTVLPSGAEGAGQAGDPPTRKAADIYEALLNDTAVSVDYYRRRFPNEPPVTKVFVNSETVPGTWLQELSTAVELPVELLDAGRGLESGRRLVGNAAVALGLALRALEPRRRAVNLLPQDLQPNPRGFLNTLAVEAAVAAIALLIIYQVSAQPVHRIAGQVNTLQSSHVVNTLGLGPADLTPDRLQQRYRDLADESSLVRTAVAAEAPVGVFLNALATCTPEAVWLRHLTYRSATTPQETRALAMDGSAYHPNTATALEAINEYVTALNREETSRRFFGSVALTAVQRNTAQSQGVTDFHVVSETGAS